MSFPFVLVHLSQKEKSFRKKNLSVRGNLLSTPQDVELP
jgi:hypothetical protein